MAKKNNSGRFFRDLSGRDDGMFMGKMAEQPGLAGAPGSAVGQPKPASQPLNIGATGAPIGGSGGQGAGIGGGMYGTGTGVNKAASMAPSDWDTGSGMATGFHRPAKEQPEALEEGGERFHSTESNSVVPASDRQRHGLFEGGAGMVVRATASPQMGKHASVSRFLGTSFEKRAFYESAPAAKGSPGVRGFVSDRAGEFVDSLGRAGKAVTEMGGGGVKSITTSPAASVAAALIALKLGHGAGKKGLVKLLPKAKPVAKPLGLVGKVMAGAGRLFSGASRLKKP